MTLRATKLFVTVLNTGAGSSSIRTNEITNWFREKIKPLDDDFNIGNASRKPVPVCGSINLMVNIRYITEEVGFFVVDNLATAVILGCDYCDKYIEEIRPRLKIVERDDGCAVTVLQKRIPKCRSRNNSSLINIRTVRRRRKR